MIQGDKLYFNEIHKQRKAKSGIFLGVVLVLFIVYFLGLLLTSRIQGIVFWLYVAASIISFAAYGIDKNAAKHGKPRIRESTLQILALGGGWPGAWLAQTILRHKTTKVSFQRVFVVTVFLNILGFIMYASPAVSASILGLLGGV